MFTYERDGAGVLEDLAEALAAAGWPLDRDGGAVTTRRDTLEVVATADGETVLVDVIAEAPPADARPPRPPPMKKRPAGYPPGFPFIPGAVAEAVPGAPAGAIGMVYPKRTARALAAALRRGAERRSWMCTQETLEFVCAAGARSVDVRLSDRRGEAVMLLIASP